MLCRACVVVLLAAGCTRSRAGGDDRGLNGGAGLVGDVWIENGEGRNSLAVEHGPRWEGKSDDTPEVVVVFDRCIFDLGSVPEDFDLSKSIVVSFEGERVQYFDFRDRYGGSFVRPLPTGRGPVTPP